MEKNPSYVFFRTLNSQGAVGSQGVVLTPGRSLAIDAAVMPYGIPVGSLAIGEPGAKNAALLAVSILALNDPKLAKKWAAFRRDQTNTVLKQKLPK